MVVKFNEVSKEITSFIYKYNQAIQENNIDESNQALLAIKDICSDNVILMDNSHELYLKNNPDLEFIKEYNGFKIYYDKIEGKYYNRNYDLYIDNSDLYAYNLA